MERLGVTSIDLYQFHGISDFNTYAKVIDPDGPMAVVQKAKRMGLVKHIGITTHSIDVAKEAVKSGFFEAIMFPFNFVTCEAADELLPLTREHDVGFIAMKPLHGGMIQNVTIAFKYLLQFPDVVCIPGIERIQEIDEIIQALREPWQVTEAEQSEMKRLREELGTRFCRRCDYCQPCPEDIPISMVMDTKCLLNGMPLEHVFSDRFANMLEKAANCTKCGECQEKVPLRSPHHRIDRGVRQPVSGREEEISGTESFKLGKNILAIAPVCSTYIQQLDGLCSRPTLVGFFISIRCLHLYYVTPRLVPVYFNDRNFPSSRLVL